jgi:hypothetical protein
MEKKNEKEKWKKEQVNCECELEVPLSVLLAPSLVSLSRRRL